MAHADNCFVQWERGLAFGPWDSLVSLGPWGATPVFHSVIPSIQSGLDCAKKIVRLIDLLDFWTQTDEFDEHE